MSSVDVVVETERVVLEATQFQIQRVIPDADRRALIEPHVWIEPVTREMILCCQVILYGSPEHHYEDYFEYPADWWSHFKWWARQKNSWWLRWVWWLKPPCWKECRFSAKGRLLFPEIPGPIRDRYRAIEYVQAETLFNVWKPEGQP